MTIKVLSGDWARVLVVEVPRAACLQTQADARQGGLPDFPASDC